MTIPTFDLAPFLDRHEGQHFDRRSVLEGEPGRKRLRDRRRVRGQVAGYVAGFANAEGSVLILGVDDDRAITGHQLPPDAFAALLYVATLRLRPQAPGFVRHHDGRELIVFDVARAHVPEGDGFPLHIPMVIEEAFGIIRKPSRLVGHHFRAVPGCGHALEQLVGWCIFGVDLNPMNVELCKIGLWTEAAAHLPQLASRAPQRASRHDARADRQGRQAPHPRGRRRAHRGDEAPRAATRRVCRYPRDVRAP